MTAPTLAGWLGSRADEVGDDGCEIVATLDGGAVAVVDAGGAVSPWGSPWTLDWWVGAEDRWHIPAREAGVRQSLLDHAPVVETAMRVPGGDVVSRCFSVVEGGGTVVVDFENRSPVPVALALAVRPWGTGTSRGPSAVVIDERVVTIDGQTAVVFSRPPRAAAAGTGDGDILDLVTSGAAQPIGQPIVAHCRAGRAHGAFVFPLAHSATVRVALPLGGVVDPARLPAAEAVARGWSSHVQRSVRLELPEGLLADSIHRSMRRLLLAGAVSATHRPRRPERRAMRSVAGALRAFGFDAEAAAVDSVRRWPRPSRSPLPVELLDLAGRSAEAESARRALVDDRDGLAILPSLPPGWAGQPIEVIGLPTGAGTLSFAVRWHGPRPALLWELESHAPVVLRAPGLDPSWSSSERRGEVLLASFDDEADGAGQH